MASVNEVRIIGNLGRDPEIKYTKSNDMVANFSVATSESWKDKQGEWQEKTEWHRVVAWRWVAEKVEKTLKKGVQVYVEGKLETRKWEDENGKAHYSTEIIASKVMALGRENEGGKPAGADETQHFNPPKMDDGPHPVTSSIDEDDDLPF